MKKLQFKDLCDDLDILTALERLEYINPTDVQKQVIPAIKQGNDLIVQSATGSGKTAAFAIPTLEDIDVLSKKPQVVVLTPTRELAVQIDEEFSLIGRLKKIRSVAVYGKQPMKFQEAILKQRVHVICATPGRLIDHINRGNIDISELKYFILDEADEMMNMGFIDEVEDILRLIEETTKVSLFSATMPKKIRLLAKKHLIDHEFIKIETNEKTKVVINQEVLICNQEEQFDNLIKVIYSTKPTKAIIFCNLRTTVDEVLEGLRKLKLSVCGLHGGMHQKNRLKSISDFKSGYYNILVATDVAARGIHVDNISHIYNYDLPYEGDTYVHRIGRTARIGNDGNAVSIITYNQKFKLDKIKKANDYEINEFHLADDELIETFKIDYLKQNNKTKEVTEPKGKELNKQIKRIRINAGKDKKIRPGDILGTLLSIDDVTTDDVGIISVERTCSFVEIFNNKGSIVISKLQNKKIKGKPRKYKVIS